MTRLLVLFGGGAVVYPVAWMVVRLRGCAVVQRVTTQALDGCPPEQRSGVLRASGELAAKLTGNAKPPGPTSPVRKG